MVAHTDDACSRVGVGKGGQRGWCMVPLGVGVEADWRAAHPSTDRAGEPGRRGDAGFPPLSLGTSLGPS